MNEQTQSEIYLLAAPEVKGTLYHVPEKNERNCERNGVFDSMEQALADGGIITAPYHHVFARVLNSCVTAELWKQKFDCSAEFALFEARKSFKGFGRGVYLAIVVNGQTFSYDVEGMRAFVQGRGGPNYNQGLLGHCIPLERGYDDRLLGDNLVYAPSDGAVQEISVPVFNSAQFLEEQGNSSFLRGHPSYVVVLTREEVEKHTHSDDNGFLSLVDDNCRYYYPDSDLLSHLPGQVLAGGTVLWRMMLEKCQERDNVSFAATIPELPVGSGNIVCLNAEDAGFGESILESKYIVSGDCVRVDSESLDALVEAGCEMLSVMSAVNNTWVSNLVSALVEIAPSADRGRISAAVQAMREKLSVRSYLN